MIILDPPEPRTVFENSRRLTGPNRHFASTGAVLDVSTEVLGAIAHDPAAHARWQRLTRSMCVALGWSGDTMALRHQSGTLLAIAAPGDQLFTATEINEWAWEQACEFFSGFSELKNASPHGLAFDQIHAKGADFSVARVIFQAQANAEKNSAVAVSALVNASRQHGLPVFVDDISVSIGAGAGSHTWELTALPTPAEVPWAALYNIPTALVTGSNGKTTTVRLLAAMLAAMLAAGSKLGASVAVGYSCTEGVVVGGEQVESGDYSGPAGARTVLRHPNAHAAVLETARGGILRRGLAVEAADVAIITNISADHFGEYGIDNMDDLADVKLVVARALNQMEPAGTLVLNADDPVLLSRAADFTGRVALFALDDNNPHLVRVRKQSGAATCAVKAGELLLTRDDMVSSLGKVAEMPLTMGGVAAYNIANIAAAALAAAALGVDAQTIAHVLMHFGDSRHDNPGRLERWNISGISVLIDYAHNPDGLANLLRVSQSVQRQPRGRFGLLLGQAGNREDGAISELAQVAAEYKPDLIVIKEIASMLRGREFGEVPRLLQDRLSRSGYAIDNIRTVSDEVDAARVLLQWAQADDVLVLPIHQKPARTELITLLDAMVASQWQAGSPLPTRLDCEPLNDEPEN